MEMIIAIFDCVMQVPEHWLCNKHQRKKGTLRTLITAQNTSMMKGH
jgi:hypothetical protein